MTQPHHPRSSSMQTFFLGRPTALYEERYRRRQRTVVDDLAGRSAPPR